jgi:hypothetical protein
MLFPMVVSDHKFVSINLTNDYSVMDHDNAATTPTSNMTMIDAYDIRLNAKNWKKPEYFLSAQQSGLANMSLNDFCQKYNVGKQGEGHRNKITCHREKDILVSRFYPCCIIK